MTKICVFGDVHGSLPALEAVIDHAGECNAWWCVGDTVGYGPYPNECEKKVEGMGALAVAGNHDLGSIGRISLAGFNIHARLACEWTGNNLEGFARTRLESLPLRAEPEPGIMVVHGSPVDPVWEYVLSAYDALVSFEAESAKLFFHGHSHAPAVFTLTGEGTVELSLPGDGTEVHLEDGCRYMVNVGSVGQPRDGDPRACYVTYRPCDGVVTYHRVTYPIAEVQERMEEVGLPGFLARRLAVGR